MANLNPILVEVTRGNMVESTHTGAAIVMDIKGRVLASWGDVERLIFPRSAVKPIQAVPLIETGAADALHLSSKEIALACASHNGEETHTTLVAQWLENLGLGMGDLECGTHAPYDNSTTERMIRTSQPFCALHNNCSGKHTGLLSLCRHLEHDSKDYIKAAHPVQSIIKNALERFTGHRLSSAALGIDGCGIPVYGIPLKGVALGMAKFARPEEMSASEENAVLRIRESMTENSYLVAGSNKFDTAVMNALKSDVLTKTGAEGVYCCTVISQGIGIALKIDDGATRASEVALGGILSALGVVKGSIANEFQCWFQPAVHNVAGVTVGTVRPSELLVI